MADELDSVWDSADCAAFLKCSRKHFLRDVRFREGFPGRLPWSKELQPRWSSKAVREWALRPDYANAA